MVVNQFILPYLNFKYQNLVGFLQLIRLDADGA